MKKYSKKEVAKIVKTNPLVKKDLLEAGQRELKRLEKLNVVPAGYNLVIPYSRSVKLAIE